MGTDETATGGIVILPGVRHIEYRPSQGPYPSGFTLQFTGPLEGDRLGVTVDVLARIYPNMVVNLVLSSRDRITVLEANHDHHVHTHENEEGADSRTNVVRGDELLQQIAAAFSPEVKLTGGGKYVQGHFDFEVHFMVLNWGAETQHSEALDDLVTKLHGVDDILAVDREDGVIILKVHGKFSEKESWLTRALIEAVGVHLTLVDARRSGYAFALL